MKQIIRLTEADIRNMVMESTKKVLNEEIDEFGIGNLRRPKSNRFNSGAPERMSNIGGGTSSGESAAENRKLFNNMGSPYSGLKNKLKGAMQGFRQGAESMQNNQNLANEYGNMQQKQFDLTRDLEHSQNLADEYGLARRQASHGRVNMNKNNVQQKQFALVRDLEQDVEQDAKKFNMNAKTVDNALQYTSNDVKRQPQKFGLAQTNNNPQQRMVAEAVNRAIRKYINSKK